MKGSEYSSEKIVCPYCQDECEAMEHEDYDENGFERTCDECGKVFRVQPFCSWSWTTNQNCEMNDKKHNWKTSSEDNHCIGRDSENGEHIYCQCSKCGLTKFIEKKELSKPKEKKR